MLFFTTFLGKSKELLINSQTRYYFHFNAIRKLSMHTFVVKNIGGKTSFVFKILVWYALQCNTGLSRSIFCLFIVMLISTESTFICLMVQCFYTLYSSNGSR